MTLYLKYRPRNLDELDLTDVAESLKKIVSSGQIPHAFLFAGPKGTGKTSAARILAKIVNCENLQGINPCDKCEQCISITKGTNLDVIEMDAASHRGIDDVRILRDAVKLSPVSAKKKIYIIDEAHMLTTEASNALLKVLEEPPEHVIFILATTNPEKLIDTIRSRTTYIPFRKASTSEVVRSLKRVVTGEKIPIGEDGLEVVAEASGGSFRDGIKILEQLVSEKRDLRKESLEEVLFKRKDFDLDRFINLLTQKNAEGLLSEIEIFEAKGVSIENFLELLLKRLQEALLAKSGIKKEDIEGIEKKDLITLIDLLLEASRIIPDSPIEELPLEIAIVKWCAKKSEETGNDEGDGLRVANKGEEKEEAQKDEDFKATHDSFTDSKFMIQDPNINDDVWKKILALVKPINASVEALLRSAKPIAYDGKTLTLGVFYKFHKERLEEVHHRKILEDVITGVFQSRTRVVCTLMAPPPKKIIEEAKTDNVLTEGADPDITKIAEEIFGS